jgi:type I restriction enzyme S subunit
MSDFPRARLGSFLRHRKEFFTLDDTAHYKRVRVQLHNKGILLRDIVQGADLKTKQQQRVGAGDLLVAEIDAKVGGFGIVPPDLDGAIVSSHYFLFEVDEGKCIKGWLDAFIRSGGLEEQVKARGSTNYAAISPAHVLELEIPLPSVPEQRQIVARIEELAARIEEARSLHRRASSQAELICRSFFIGESGQGAVLTPMRELVRRREPDVSVREDEAYHFAGVKCFGKGVFAGQHKLGTDFSYGRLTRLRGGDFVYPKLMAWEGALAIVPPECDGLVVSPEFPVFEVDENCVFQETLDVYFRTPEVWPLLATISTGTNVRRRRLNPEDFLEFRIPLPPMARQMRLRAVKARVDALIKLQAEACARLDALLPAVRERAFSGGL